MLKTTKRTIDLRPGDIVASNEIVQRVTPIDNNKVSVKLYNRKYRTVRFATWGKYSTIFMSKENDAQRT